MQLNGLTFFHGTYQQARNDLQNRIISGTRTLVITPNPEMLYDTHRDTGLQKTLEKADILYPDGVGIFVAYQIANSKLPTILKYCALPFWCLRAIRHTRRFAEKYGERITGSRLTKDLLSFAANEKMQVLIFDSPVVGNSARDIQKKEFQSMTKTILETKFPGIRCNLMLCESVSELVNLSTSQLANSIIFAVQGNGKQEKFLAEFQKTYPNSGVALAVGGSIDIITGFREDAPDRWKKLGFEWLYRLLKNPKRHGKRMRKVISFIFSIF